LSEPATNTVTTCGTCAWYQRCSFLFPPDAELTECDWEPSRYSPAPIAIQGDAPAPIATQGDAPAPEADLGALEGEVVSEIYDWLEALADPLKKHSSRLAKDIQPPASIIWHAARAAAAVFVSFERGYRMSSEETSHE